MKQAVSLIEGLYKAFLAKDMSLLEINPLVVTKSGQVICLDAKINFDDNALYRHPDMQALRDPDEEDPTEREAAKYDLNYIKLDGSIGCMVNGAGPRHGDDGHHQALRLGARELPRCRRRRVEGESDRGAQDHPLRSEREGHPGQHLRRHHALRHHRQRHRRRGEGSIAVGSGGGAARRHQCRAGQGNPRQIGARASSRPTTSPMPLRRSSTP